MNFVQTARRANRGGYSPIDDPADYRWLWRWKYKKYVPITPALFGVGGFLGRCVVLTHQVDGTTYRFHEAEHIIGWPHALGLRGVCIWLEDSDWPPYMCQAQLRREIKNLLIPQLLLKPYQPARTVLSAENGRPRTAVYHPDHLRGLIVKTNVNYGDERIGHHELEFWGGVDEEDLMKVLSARTLGRPPALWVLSKAGRFIASLLGREWPHHERIIWPWTTSAEEMNEETGRHRFLDALGVLAFVPPPGHYLCGIYHSVLGGHMTDIGLAKELYRKARSAALPLCRVA